MDQKIKNILNDKLNGEEDMLTEDEKQQVWNKLDEKLGTTATKIIPWWQLAAAACVGLLIGLTIMKFWVTGASDEKYTSATSIKKTVDTVFVKQPLNNQSMPTLPANSSNRQMIARTNPNNYKHNKIDTVLPTTNKELLPVAKDDNAIAVENKTNTNNNIYTENSAINTVHLLDIDDADITSLAQDKKKNALRIPIAFFQSPINAQRQRDDADEPPTIVKGFSKN